MKRLAFASALLALSAPAGAQSVDVGRANWDKLPKLEVQRSAISYSTMVGYVGGLLKERKCAFKGHSPRKFDISVPYAVLLDPDGKVNRVLVSETNCEPLEVMVGEMAIALGEVGAIRGAPSDRPRWYADEVNFTLE